MSKTVVAAAAPVSVITVSSPKNAPRPAVASRSAAVSGVRSSLVFAAASAASANEVLARSESSRRRRASNDIETTIEMTQEMPREILDLELAPLPVPAPPKPTHRMIRTRSLITPDVAASAFASAASAASAVETDLRGTVPTTTVEVAPAPRQIAVPVRSLSPIKNAPVLAYQGFGALAPVPVAPAHSPRSAAVREAFVAFSSFACVGAIAALLASGLLNFSARPVSAQESRPTTAAISTAKHAATLTTAAAAVAATPAATRRR